MNSLQQRLQELLLVDMAKPSGINMARIKRFITESMLPIELFVQHLPKHNGYLLMFENNLQNSLNNRLVADPAYRM